MSKILLISGSPRKGNVEYILSEIKKRLNRIGLRAVLILLRKRKIKECTGCSLCQEGKPCPINDDAMVKLNKVLVKSDYIVIGTPTYFDMVSGLLKKWMDRTNPLYPKNQLKNKRGSIIAVGAASRQSIGKAAENVKHFFNIFKIMVDQIMLFEGEYSDDVKNNKLYQKKIKEFTDKIIKLL